LLSNVALSVLDEYIAKTPGGPATSTVERAKRRRHGLANVKLVRYADDWCLLVHGTRVDAQTWRDMIAEVLSPMGLRLSPDKTLITHIALLTELTAEFRQVVWGAGRVSASLPA
jgi:RNA-directed DNA polymerase